MPTNTQTAFISCNAQANAHGALLNNGYLRIYSGAQPANSDAAVGAAVMLNELRFGATAFQPAVNGVITANAMTAGAGAPVAGVAAWFRAYRQDGTTAVYDGNAGTSGQDLVLSDTSIPQSAQVSVTDLTYTVPRAA